MGIFLLAALGLSTGPVLRAATVTVKMRPFNATNYVFDPTNITINAGDTVKWTNTVSDPHDSTHDPSSGPRLWASPVFSSISANNTYSFSFGVPGVYPYYCQTHFFKGHTEETGTVSVIALNIAPTVSISSPVDAAAFFAPASFPIIATASDMDGSVAQVEFFRGTTSIGVTSESSSTNYVSALGAGTYALTAVAIDNQGAKATSSVVHVTVAAPPTITVGLAQQLADGTFQFRISGGSAGQTCVVDACSTLPDWSPIHTTNFPDTKCQECPFIDFTDAVTHLNRRFYRCRISP